MRSFHFPHAVLDMEALASLSSIQSLTTYFLRTYYVPRKHWIMYQWRRITWRKITSENFCPPEIYILWGNRRFLKCIKGQIVKVLWKEEKGNMMCEWNVFDGCPGDFWADIWQRWGNEGETYNRGCQAKENLPDRGGQPVGPKGEAYGPVLFQEQQRGWSTVNRQEDGSHVVWRTDKGIWYFFPETEAGRPAGRLLQSTGRNKILVCTRMRQQRRQNVVGFQSKYKMEPAGFADRPDVKCEKEESRMTPRLLAWVNEVGNCS